MGMNYIKLYEQGEAIFQSLRQILANRLMYLNINKMAFMIHHIIILYSKLATFISIYT